MVHPEVLRKRLGKLEEYLTILEELSGSELDHFISTPQLYGSAERFLHLAIEALNDMGGHVIADENLGAIEWQRDIPKILCECGLLPDPLRAIWIQMIGFRNILVHDYLDIDRTQVYGILTTRLPDIRAIAARFVEYL